MENSELMNLIEVCEGIEVALQVLEDQPEGTQFVHLEVDHPIKYWSKSLPEDGIGDIAYLWDGQYWEPSDDGAVSNGRLDHAPYYPIASLHQAVELIALKGEGHVYI